MLPPAADGQYRFRTEATGGTGMLESDKELIEKKYMVSHAVPL